MTVRRRTVEHTFGTIKAWMGYTHFLTKGLECVKAEMSLCVLAYNIKRMMRHSKSARVSTLFTHGYSNPVRKRRRSGSR